MDNTDCDPQVQAQASDPCEEDPVMCLVVRCIELLIHGEAGRESFVGTFSPVGASAAVVPAYVAMVFPCSLATRDKLLRLLGEHFSEQEIPGLESLLVAEEMLRGSGGPLGA